MTARDIDLIQHRIDSAVRALTRIRANLPEIHSLAFEARRHDTEPDHGGFESRPPPGWRPVDDRAKQLWRRLETEIGRSEDLLVGLERDVRGFFFAASASPERFPPGSLISVAEHDRLLAKQRDRRANGEHVPERLEPQQHHPGRRP